MENAPHRAADVRRRNADRAIKRQSRNLKAARCARPRQRRCASSSNTQTRRRRRHWPRAPSRPSLTARLTFRHHRRSDGRDRRSGHQRVHRWHGRASAQGRCFVRPSSERRQLLARQQSSRRGECHSPWSLRESGHFSNARPELVLTVQRATSIWPVGGLTAGRHHPRTALKHRPRVVSPPSTGRRRRPP